MKKLRFVLILLLLASIIVGCSEEAAQHVAEDQEEIKKVKVLQIQAQEIDDGKKISAEILPFARLEVFSDISAMIKMLHIQVGDIVQEGQLLVELEDRETALQYEQEQLNSQKAQLDLEKSRVEQEIRIKAEEENFSKQEIAVKAAENNVKIRQAQLQETHANYAKAEMTYQNKEREYENMKILYDNGSVSKEELLLAAQALETSKMDLELQQLRVEQAQRELQIAEEELETEKMALDRAKVRLEQTKSNKEYQLLALGAKETELHVQAAKNKLEKMHIKAPISGIVTHLNGNEGENVERGKSVVQIEQHGFIRIRALVSEQDLEYVQTREQLDVFVPFLEEKRSADVISVSMSKKSGESGYALELMLENEDLKIRPGMNAYVVLEREQQGKRIVVPVNAVIKQEGKTYVFVIQNQKAVQREVETGVTRDLLVEITAGLKEGEQIAIVGQSMLQDGVSVEIIE